MSICDINDKKTCKGCIFAKGANGDWCSNKNYINNMEQVTEKGYCKYKRRKYDK